ncbi:MAG: cell division protein ZapA [Pseudomonadota bacterium]
MTTTKTSSSKAVTINVLGREFRVAAPDGEERQLMASVDLVNRKMKEIRDTGKVVGNERIAIMAALNLAHEQLHAAVDDTPQKRPSSKATTTTPNANIDEAYIKGKLNLFEATLEKAISEQEKLF